MVAMAMEQETFCRDRKVFDTQSQLYQTFQTVVKALKAFETTESLLRRHRKNEMKLGNFRVPFVGFLGNWIISLEKNCLWRFLNTIYEFKKKERWFAGKQTCCTYCEMEISDLDPFRIAESSNFTHKMTFQETLSFRKILKKPRRQQQDLTQQFIFECLKSRKSS